MGKEEKPKKKTKPKKKEKSPPIVEFRPQRVTEDPLKAFEERMKQQEEEDNKRVKAKMQEKIQNEEAKVDKLRLEMRKKMKDFKIEKPKPFVPMEPVKKSSKLREMEKSIQKVHQYRLYMFCVIQFLKCW